MRSLLINISIAAILVSVPGTLFVIGWGLVLIYHETGSLLVFLACCASIVISALSIASLVDNQKHQDQ